MQLEEIVLLGAAPGLKIRMIVDPLKLVIKEHTHADNWLAEVRKLTDNFKYPPFADNLFRQFYQELKALKPIYTCISISKMKYCFRRCIN